jgi:hypothetical protein
MGELPLVVVIKTRSGDNEFLSIHNKQGVSDIEPKHRNLRMPPKKEYLVIYRNIATSAISDSVDLFGYIAATKEEAETTSHGADNYITTVEVEVRP